MLTGEPILVVGAPRSGASVISTALSKMGVYLGAEQDFYQPNENNLDGAHEIRRLQEVNLRGYSVFATNFYQAENLPTDWKSVPGSKALAEEIRSLVDGMFSGKAVWGLKDPAITGLVPIYRALFEEQNIKPRFAIYVRHPLSVAASHIAHEKQWGLEAPDTAIAGLQPPVGEHALGIWMHYTLSALKNSRGFRREAFCSEDFIREPDTTIRRLARLIPQTPSDQQISDAMASVSAQDADVNVDLDAWPSLISRTYQCCLKASRDGQAFNGGKFDNEIEELCNEANLMGRMIRPIQLPSGQFVFSWMQGNKPGFQAVKYSPTGGWQSLRMPLDAPPGSVVQIDPYQMPCQIWIRRAVWLGTTETRVQLQPGPNGVLQELYGLKRLTVFGPGPVISQIPMGTKYLEIEFQVRSGHNVMNDIVGLLRGGIEQARRGAMRPGTMPTGPR